MYTAIRNPPASGASKTTSFMAEKGVDLRSLPETMDVKRALSIINYIITAEGGLDKRGGQSLVKDASQTVPGLMLKEWSTDFWLAGYSTTLVAYKVSTGTLTTIKSNFVESGLNGVRYGDYFLVASPGDKVGRVSFELDYDGQTGNFGVGELITGATSGATAIVLEDNDGGATGTLTLGTISGTFQNGEVINGDASGVADVNGILSFTFTSITNAPIARGITTVESRAVAFDIKGARETVQYSEVDDGTNPPFTAWTNTTAASAGGKESFRRGGTVNIVLNLGRVIVVFAEKGKWAFQIDTIDSAGTLTKIDTGIYHEIDSGAKAAIQTDDGIYFVNKDGLWVLVAIGQENIKFSDQVVLRSRQLGNKFFDDVNLDGADIVKDDKKNIVFVTLRQDAASNNAVLAYNTDLKAFSTIKSWAINKFMKIDGTIYGIGSDTVKFWKLFDGNDDDGADIDTEFLQEITVGSLETMKEMLGQYIKGNLSASTILNIRFDIYDREGRFVKDKLILKWTRQFGLVASNGFGSAGWGKTAWGGALSTGLLIEAFDGFRARIKNFNRLRIRITGGDQVPHTINWFSLITKEKSFIRRRSLTNIT